MQIVEKIRLKLLERNLANAYRECCKGLYEDEMFKEAVSFPVFPTLGYFHINKTLVLIYSRKMRRMGYDSKHVLIKTAKKMVSRGEPISFFYGLFDIDDFSFKPSDQKTIPRIEESYVDMVLRDRHIY